MRTSGVETGAGKIQTQPEESAQTASQRVATRWVMPRWAQNCWTAAAGRVALVGERPGGEATEKMRATAWSTAGQAEGRRRRRRRSRGRGSRSGGALELPGRNGRSRWAGPDRTEGRRWLERWDSCQPMPCRVRRGGPSPAPRGCARRGGRVVGLRWGDRGEELLPGRTCPRLRSRRMRASLCAASAAWDRALLRTKERQGAAGRTGR